MADLKKSVNFKSEIDELQKRFDNEIKSVSTRMLESVRVVTAALEQMPARATDLLEKAEVALVTEVLVHSGRGDGFYLDVTLEGGGSGTISAGGYSGAIPMTSREGRYRGEPVRPGRYRALFFLMRLPDREETE